MRNICITFLIVGIIILSGIGVLNEKKTVHEEYLRIHIRANSNLDIDQAVKYKVKDAVVNFLTPFIAECTSKEKAVNMLSVQLSGVEKVANKVLYDNGFNYQSRAKIKNEEFPTRVYSSFTLESGFYDALIIELGNGTGDNWWCVVYPPLCFTDGASYQYKSKIFEIILDFQKRFNKGEI